MPPGQPESSRPRAVVPLPVSKASLLIRRFYTSLLFARLASFWKQGCKADQSLLGFSFFVLSAITVSCLSHLQRPSGLKEKTNEGRASYLAPGQPEPSCLRAVAPSSHDQATSFQRPSDALMRLQRLSDALMRRFLSHSPLREQNRRPGNSFKGLPLL